ncbi:MAG: glutamate--tRNA ligase [Candidatus Saccharimonadales bacterium]
MTKIRTRFAPSPTGYLHVGGIRTALFAWLIARQNDGSFVLRFEDTDKKREVEGAREHLSKSLRALGINYDEGPDIGGPFAPYVQSERLDHYQQWAQKLIAVGRAYADPYTPEEVDAFRKQAQAEKRPFLYRNHRPESAGQQTPAWDGTTPLRFKSEPKSYTRVDAVMGELNTGPEVIDDFILIKSDGYPTYNFAHIIDDLEMEISHVIRGQEFLASTPNYLNLYEALGIGAPIIATVPHILGPSGSKKLSKRDGAKDVLDYIRDGYLPEALINFIASMGWNDGTPQEIFSRQELIQKFSLERVQRSGARFDENRLLWMNGHWIRNLSLSDLFERSHNFWPASAANYDDTYKKQVLGLIQERLKYLAEIPQLTSFFFEDLPVNLELITSNKQLKKFELSELKALLEQARRGLVQSNFEPQDIQDRLNQLLAQTKQKPGVLFGLIRIATTWAPSSPSLAESLHILGKDRVFVRLDTSIATL